MILGLVFRYGVPFVSGLIEKAHRKEHVTPEEWVALLAKIEVSGETLIPKRPDA